MIKQMRLRCKIAIEDGQFLCTSQVFDGGSFSFKTDRLHVDLDEPITAEMPEVSGYAIVQQESQMHDAAYITLPHPSIVHGRHLTVKALQLIPMVGPVQEQSTQT